MESLGLKFSKAQSRRRSRLPKKITPISLSLQLTKETFAANCVYKLLTMRARTQQRPHRCPLPQSSGDGNDMRSAAEAIPLFPMSGPCLELRALVAHILLPLFFHWLRSYVLSDAMSPPLWPLYVVLWVLRVCVKGEDDTNLCSLRRGHWTGMYRTHFQSTLSSF